MRTAKKTNVALWAILTAALALLASVLVGSQWTGARRVEGAPSSSISAAALSATSSTGELAAAELLPAAVIDQAPPPTEHTDSLHVTGRDSRFYGSIVGAQRTKSESVIRYQAPGTVCTGPIYQPLWLGLANAPGNSWLEVGTAHWCDGSRSWYGFSAIDFSLEAYYDGTLQGGWAFNVPITGTTTHVHHIERAHWDCNKWVLWVDQTVMAIVDLGGCYIGADHSMGLESYTNWAVFDGPGAMMTDAKVRVWDGGANIWWEDSHLSSIFQSYQTYYRPHTTNGVTQNGGGFCQNVLPHDCG